MEQGDVLGLVTRGTSPPHKPCPWQGDEVNLPNKFSLTTEA